MTVRVLLILTVFPRRFSTLAYMASPSAVVPQPLHCENNRAGRVCSRVVAGKPKILILSGTLVKSLDSGEVLPSKPSTSKYSRFVATV